MCQVPSSEVPNDLEKEEEATEDREEDEEEEEVHTNTQQRIPTFQYIINNGIGIPWISNACMKKKNRVCRVRSHVANCKVQVYLICV